MVKDVSDRARQYRIIFNLIQCFARNWPWYSLRGLHIRITWLSLYGIRIPLFSLYGIQMPFFSYISIQPIVLCMGLLFNLIQCFARNWPWYSLHGLHSPITWFSLYGIRIPLFSLYGIQMPFFSYMLIQHIVLCMGLLWAAVDSSLSQGPLLWRHNDMTVIVSRDTRGRERDTRQRECTAITSIDSLLNSMQFVTYFWEITPYILRDAIVG